jgi:hypothetical protein
MPRQRRSAVSGKDDIPETRQLRRWLYQRPRSAGRIHTLHSVALENKRCPRPSLDDSPSLRPAFPPCLNSLVRSFSPHAICARTPPVAGHHAPRRHSMRPGLGITDAAGQLTLARSNWCWSVTSRRRKMDARSGGLTHDPDGRGAERGGRLGWPPAGGDDKIDPVSPGLVEDL